MHTGSPLLLVRDLLRQCVFWETQQLSCWSMEMGYLGAQVDGPGFAVSVRSTRIIV